MNVYLATMEWNNPGYYEECDDHGYEILGVCGTLEKAIELIKNFIPEKEDGEIYELSMWPEGEEPINDELWVVASLKHENTYDYDLIEKEYCIEEMELV